MAPKKRAAEDLASASAPKRRSTRIASRPAPPAEEPPTLKPTPKAKSSKSKAKGPEPPRKSQSKVPAAKSSKPSKQVPKPASSKPPSTPAPTASGQDDYIKSHVSSPLISKPIICHTYGGTHDPGNGDLIFTHGAGGTLSASAVVNFARGYATSSPVLAFQGSMNLGSRVKGFLAFVPEGKGKKGDVLRFGGRSMGARAAVMAATQVIEEGFEGKIELVLVSYPLKGPKGGLRDGILLDLPEEVEVKFVIGDRDSMCPLGELTGVRSKMKAKTSLLTVKGADHGMHVKPARAEKVLGETTGKFAAERKALVSDEEIWWDVNAEEVERGLLQS